MDTLAIVSMLAICWLMLLVLFMQARKLSNLTAKAIDLSSPVLSRIEWLQALLEQSERSAREESARNRVEQTAHAQGLRCEVVSLLTGVGDSVSAKLEGFTRLNDQRLELLRSGIEQRLDLFTTDSGRKVDGLTQAVIASSTKLQDELSAKLVEFKSSLDTTISQTHSLQGQQAEAVAGAIRLLQAGIDASLSQLREETGTSFRNLGDGVLSTLTGISQMQNAELTETRKTVDTRLIHIQVDNERKLEQMRQTVDEKLQGTLESRLGASFKQVSERLEQVYTGLGEMKTLATGVGDLKRVLTNIKVRGTWGEVQLGAIIEEILAPDQFRKNVATARPDERVEYAVKLPGRDSLGEPVWLPIDAKFPFEDYQRLMYASERGDGEAVDRASRQLEATLRLTAKDLSEKYLAPPRTTDFGILFLPSEGLYAEAMRYVGLADSIQREHRVVLAGPSTLAALLSALQMGFRTLAIERRSSEVWETLGSVKIEFGKYAGVLAKVKKKLGEAQNTIDNAETRTRAIQRRLRDVEGPDDPELDAEFLAEEEALEGIPVLIGGS
ncbi:MAG: recombination protein RmuC [Acidobacteriaceae bacterium]|jgi:DNA recombination protein RmuC|nr:recombination protein RmuC [Acidobacteriaceae bacterium]